METALLSMAQQFSGLPMEALIGGPLGAAAKANSLMAMTQTKFMMDTCFTATPVGEQAEVAMVPPSAPGVTPVTPGTMGSPKIPAHTNYTPIMLMMTLTRGVITPGHPGSPAVAADPTAVPPVLAQDAVDPSAAIIQNVKTQFNLPMLTIIPINSLAVETVDINFEMEVKSSFGEEASQTSEKQISTSGSFEAKAGWGPFSVTVKGSASYDSKDSSTHSTHYQKSNSAKYTVNVHAGQLPLPKGVNTIIEAFTQSIQPITLTA